MDNGFCGHCKYYRDEKGYKYICKNRDSVKFNKNPAPFQGCSSFSKKGIHMQQVDNENIT